MRPLLLAVLLFAGCRRGVPPEYRLLGTFSGSRPAEGVGEISVSTHVGGLTLETRAGAGIAVEAEVSVRSGRAEQKPDPERDLRISLEGSTLRIESGHLEGPDRDDWRVHLRVAAPPDLAVSLRAGVGDVEVKGRTAAAKAATGVGSVSLRGAFAEIELRAGAGTISVEAERVAGGEARTGTGDVRFATGAGPAGDLSLEAGVGSISLSLPGSYGGRLNLQAGVGRIDAGPSMRIPDQGVGSSLVWQLDPRTTSPGLWAKTGVGDIVVRRSP